MLVAVAPAGAVWGLRAAGIVGAFPVCAALGALLSLITCSLAARLWERSDRAGDVLFGELMIWGWVRRCHQQRRLADAASLLGARPVDGATDPLSLSLERRTQLLERLAADLEARDPYTHGHSRRVARYATMIAKRMGLPADETARIRLAAALHDVGKLETPLVSILEDPGLSAIVRHHHERLDGTGYPDRLPGDRIPLGSRIISIADTFDAITSARPYRAARPHRQALKILRAEAGTQLDGDAVAAFCSVYAGRRPLSAWVAVTDLGERLLTWLAPDALGSTARVAALAAGAAAVGGGVAALPASGRPAGHAARPAAVIRASSRTGVAPLTASRSANPTAPAAETARGSSQAGARPSGSGSSGATQPSAFGGRVHTRAGVHSLGGTPASSTRTTSAPSSPASTPSSGVSSSSDSSSNPSPDPVSVQTPTTTPSGTPAPSVGVTTSSSGPGSGSVGVSASTGTGQSVGAGVSVGPTGGVGVTATLPGVGSVKIGIGGG